MDMDKRVAITGGRRGQWDQMVIEKYNKDYILKNKEDDTDPSNFQPLRFKLNHSSEVMDM